MASSFFGIEIAKTGLFMAQKQLNLTSHNIANANTDGYTRQRIVTQSIDPHGVTMRWSPTDMGRVGGGVRLQSLERIRDSYIDRELRREYADGGKLATQEEWMIYLESIFNEANGDGISTALADFFNSLQELQDDANSYADRVDVITKAGTLTEMLHMQYNKLLEMQKSMNENMKTTAERVNTLLDVISEYNKQILRYEISGEKANDLRDKRDLLLDELSQLIDITYEEDSNRKLVIKDAGGNTLMHHTTYDHLDVAVNANGLYDINRVDKDNHATIIGALNYTSGELEGYRIMRDGNTSDQYGIPYVLKQLDDFAAALVNGINAIHSRGYTLPGAGGASTNGVNFFEPGNTSAGNITINADIKKDPNLIACAKDPVDLDPSNPEVGDNRILLEILALIAAENTAAMGGKSFEGFLSSISTELGSQSFKIQTLFASQLSVVNNLEDKRYSISSVSIDEEVTLMLQFQHMYAANSRMITALDQALDKLINETGIVGR